MKLILLFLFSFVFLQTKSQDISFSGQWEATLPTENNGPSAYINFQIGKPENKILFPAKLVIRIDSFNATYHLLLVKKNARQLAISKNKFAHNEFPFSIGNWTIMLNGALGFYKNNKGQSFLKLERIDAKKYGIALMDTKKFSDEQKKTAEVIFNFFQNTEMILYKTSNKAWEDPATKSITQPRISPVYFSLYDTLFVNDSEGKIIFNPNKDNDIISINNNHDIIVNEIDSKKKRADEFFNLDTGLNILVISAEDFGKNPPCGAAVKLAFNNIEKELDFNAPENLGATFIAQKIYRKYEEGKITTFRDYPNENDINTRLYPIKARAVDSLTKRNNKFVGGITTTSAQLTFTYWDNAVEDGDSISIIINDKWVAKGLFVRNQAQSLTVKLSPGPNIITFVANNLGSIPPNTSVVEIIDGDKRKSYFLQTDLNQNNMIKVYYDVSGQ